ncbi:repressor LexA [Streptomyces sp. NBC_01167]|uniref:LexA family protein n=1 Tax=Streptomyces sp. NBC_01167 TaxID=2903756 RepID=UPI0038674EF2|nr:repressor LexA [Streptomyces sp. NBC_01167]
MRKGVLRQDPKRPRAYVPTATSGFEVEFAVDAGPEQVVSDSSMVHTPLVGHIAAGVPITADERGEDVLALQKQLVGSETVFALTVRGDSMIKAHTMDSDTVAVRAQTDAGERRDRSCHDRRRGNGQAAQAQGAAVWLMPENDAFDPIPGASASILGKVVTVRRSL